MFPRQRRLHDELEEELASHIDEAIARGRSAEEARRAFGVALRFREQSRDIKLLPWLDALASDITFGWRQLKKHRVASAAAILSPWPLALLLRLSVHMSTASISIGLREQKKALTRATLEARALERFLAEGTSRYAWRICAPSAWCRRGHSFATSPRKRTSCSVVFGPIWSWQPFSSRASPRLRRCSCRCGR